MAEEQQNQGMRALIPESRQSELKPEPPQQPPQLPGPVFEPKPGWGGKFSNWWKKNFIKVALPIIIAAVIVAVTIFLRTRQEPEQESKTQVPGATDQIRTEEQVIVEEITTEEGRVESIYRAAAQKGEGTTHLARKALKEYLKENSSAGEGLRAEHKIYIEDYLKDQHGERFLEIGEELEFSSNDITQAVEMAKSLSENQLSNLSQFVPLVSGL